MGKYFKCLLIALLLSCAPNYAITGDLPPIGKIITASELLILAEAYGQIDIVNKLKFNLPTKRFYSDGCSGGCPQEFQGKSLYFACFWHDVRYYIGGSRSDKLRADAKLMLDILDITDNALWANAMFEGVRMGGDLPTSWKWGMVGVE